MPSKASGTAKARVDGDVLVAADGIHSIVRRHFYPDQGPPRWAGNMMWRMTAELDEPVLSPAHGVRVISSFREEDDKFFLLKEFIHVPERIQRSYWISPVERYRSQGGQEMTDPRINEEFLFGDVAYRPPDR